MCQTKQDLVNNNTIAELDALSEYISLACEDGIV